jgi:hypothetical protein
MEQEGGDGKEAASLQCTEKWKTKSITARGKMKSRTECLPCGMFFSMQKGFTDVCGAFLWCRFTMPQAARRDDARTGSMPSFEEFAGE